MQPISVPKTQAHISRGDMQWINERTLKFDESARLNFNKGKKDFLKAIAHSLSNITSAVSAIIYEFTEGDDMLFGVAGYATKIDETIPLRLGEHVVGQCAKTKKSLVFKNIPENYASIHIADSKVSITNLLIVPLIFNDKVYGVIELRYLKEIPIKVLYFVERVADNTAIMMESIRKNEETLEQKEKLSAQEKVLIKNIEALNTAQSEIKKQKDLAESALEQLSLQSRRIEESINYAQRIQQSILPSEEKLKQTFREAFVIYQPKDIVSGDFFWYAENEKYKFLGVIDCTGHGVPGAFMSMIGNTLLNQIILEKKVFEPAKVLSELHLGIRLNIPSREGQSYTDGMDMMFCRFEKKSVNQVEMVASGAKSYMFCINNNSVEYFKGNHQSIGGARSHEDLQFDQKTYTLPLKSQVILLTDGWIDNANKKRKRYGVRRFEKVLKENIHLSMQGLKTKIKDDMILYQEKEEQRDDITVIGVRL